MNAKALALRKYEFFWWCNILIPLILCGALYCLLNSDVFFTAVVERLFGSSPNRGGFLERLFIIVCMYGRDFFWAYAVVFAVSYLFRGSFGGLKRSFLIVLVFEAIVELIRFFAAIDGAFDVFNLVAIAIGNVLAIAVVLIHEGALV